MKTPRSQITPAIADMTLKVSNTKKLSRDIAAYLLDEGRTGELDSLMRDLVSYRADKGIVEVNVVSARELSSANKRDIEKLVRAEFKHAKHVLVNERVDTSLIGGARLELVDRQLDLTVRSKLNQFKEGVL